ncbi:hypothetical protein HPB51_006877 [Rhipicephalus microplus]|uniref:Uncharacterized protein n=1 Tax=Rhipicephalus microplus TaxID=6941 RepID=A0A9J6E8M4_RHIMP|nr:hypothetical protein HPB51_006877 [Rhipicephalus microplus]
MPPRQRTPLYQHSHPPLSLYDQPDPLSSFGIFGMGGGPFGPFPFGGGPINLGGPMGMPFGGPIGPFPPRMPTFIIIETGDDDDDDDSQLQDPLFMPGMHGGRLPSSASSSNLEPVFPTLLIQERERQRQQQRQQRAEEEERRGGRRRSRSRRHRRTAGTLSLATRGGNSGLQDTIQESKEEQKEAKGQQHQTEKASLRAPTPIEAVPSLQRHRSRKTRRTSMRMPPAAPAAKTTVMRIDHIETLTTAAEALQKVGMFGDHKNSSSGKKCIVPDPLVIKCSKSTWDTPLESKHEQNEVIIDQLSSSTRDSASASSNLSTTHSETMSSVTTTDHRLS